MPLYLRWGFTGKSGFGWIAAGGRARGESRSAPLRSPPMIGSSFPGRSAGLPQAVAAGAPRWCEQLTMPMWFPRPWRQRAAPGVRSNRHRGIRKRWRRQARWRTAEALKIAPASVRVETLADQQAVVKILRLWCIRSAGIRPGRLPAEMSLLLGIRAAGVHFSQVESSIAPGSQKALYRRRY